jgi:lysozyme-like protein
MSPRSVRTACGLAVALLSVTLSVDTARAVPMARAPASIGATAGADGAGPAAVSDALHCARPAHRVHFKKDRAVVAVAVGMAESYCRKDAVGHNPPTGGCPDGSDDRGLWQINSCYHAEVSDHCAFKPTCNARATKHISDHGKDWSPWSAFDSGAYRQYLEVARQAVNRIWRRAAEET